MSKSLKNISVVATATMMSRVLGLGRDILVTAVFGTSALASAFYTAFTLPNLFRRLLGEGALTAAFVPTLSEELRQGEHIGAFRLVNQVASWLLIVASGLVLLSMGGLWWVLQWDGSIANRGLEPATLARLLEAARLAMILFPYLLLVCMAAALNATLQTLHRFFEPALSPIWLNLAMIGLLGGAVYGGWARTADSRMLWLCAGALLGGLLQMIVPAIALAREGWRPRLDLSMSPAVRQIATLMGPTVFGSAIYLINMAVARLVGLSLNDSAVTVLNLASRLMELPIGVFAVAVSTVVFPLISKHAAAGDATNLALSYRKGMRLILVVNIPAAVGLIVLATPIIRLLFQRGEFQAADTALMEPVLATYALGLPFLAFVNLILRAFYAQKDTKTPVRAAVLSFVVNLGLSLILMGPLDTVGLAIAGNVAIVAQAWYLQRALARGRDGLSFKHLVRDLLKVLGASLAMGVLVALGLAGWVLLAPEGKWTDAIGLALLIGGGAAIYAALLWKLKIDGRDDLVAMWRRFKGKRS